MRETGLGNLTDKNFNFSSILERDFVKRTVLALLAGGAILSLVVGLVYMVAGREKAEPVRMLAVGRGTVDSSIQITGIVSSTKDVPILSPVSGKLAEQSLVVGDKVAEGSVLFRIDDREAVAEVEVRKAALREANATFAEDQHNSKTLRAILEAGGETLNAVSEAETRLQVDKAKLEKASADLRLATLKLDQYVSHAPVSGTVVSIDAKHGQFVQQGSKVMQLTATGSLEIQAKADPGDSASIRSGMPVEISTDGESGTVSEHVLRIDPVIHKDGQTDFLAVWIGVAPEKFNLRPNQQVNVKIVTISRSNVLRLPIDALVTRSGIDYAWVVLEGKLHLQPIKIGLYGDRYVEILIGLNDKQTVATLDGRPLKEGAAVVQSNAMKQP